MKENLSIFIIIFILTFLEVISMQGNKDYPYTNKEPFKAIIIVSILFFIIVKLLIFSFNTLF